MSSTAPSMEIITASPKPYIYMESRCPMEPDAISAALGAGYGALQAFMGRAGIVSQEPPLSVYVSMDSTGMTLRAAFFVSAEDAAKVGAVPNAGLTEPDASVVQAAETPGGAALKTLHIGPYSGLGATYAAASAHLKSHGKSMGMPCWEVYLNDPTVTDAADLQTEVYIPVTG